MSKLLRVFDGDAHYGDFALSAEQESTLGPVLTMLENPAMMAMITPMLRPMLAAAIAEKTQRGEAIKRDIEVDSFELRLQLVDADSAAETDQPAA